MDMVDMTFVQDFRTGKWIRCYDEKLCNEDIKNWIMRSLYATTMITKFA